VHHVQPGDTVADVAAYYGAHTDDVIAANALKAPYVITIGQVLLVPGGRMPVPPPPKAEPAPDTVEQPPGHAEVQEAAVESPRPLPAPPTATESQAAFILGIARAAQRSQHETGVPASVTI